MPEDPEDRKDAKHREEPETTELSVAGSTHPWFWYTVMFLIFCLTVNNIVKMLIQHG